MPTIVITTIKFTRFSIRSVSGGANVDGKVRFFFKKSEKMRFLWSVKRILCFDKELGRWNGRGSGYQVNR